MLRLKPKKREHIVQVNNYLEPRREPANNKWKLPSLRVFLLSVAALVVTYTHFFGVSYFNSKMAAIGFEGIAFDLSAGQSMYYAIEGYSNGLSFILQSLLSHTVPFLISGFLIGLYLVYTVWKAAFDDFFLKWIPEKIKGRLQLVEVPSWFKKVLKLTEVPSWLKKVWEVVKAFALLITVTIYAYAFQILIVITFLLLVAVLLSVMRLGNDTGKLVGERLIGSEICKTFKWSEKAKDVNIVKGCREVPINHSDPLKGLRVYKQGSTEYIVTNAGAYEVEGQQVISYRLFNCRPTETESEGAICDAESRKRIAPK